MIEMCAVGLPGVAPCFAVDDIFVAFPHSRMDEVVFVHSPMTDQLLAEARVLLATTTSSERDAEGKQVVSTR